MHTKIDLSQIIHKFIHIHSGMIIHKNISRNLNSNLVIYPLILNLYYGNY